MQTITLLQATDDLEEISRLGIAMRPQHSHQAKEPRFSNLVTRDPYWLAINSSSSTS